LDQVEQEIMTLRRNDDPITIEIIQNTLGAITD